MTHFTKYTIGPSICDPSHGMKRDRQYQNVTNIEDLVVCPKCKDMLEKEQEESCEAGRRLKKQRLTKKQG